MEEPARPALDDLAPRMRDVVAALDELARAVTSRDHLPSEAVRLAEEVSTARSALYSALIDQGWAPPPRVMTGVDLDRRLIDEPLGGWYDGKVDAE